ncbi:MAG: c-type cytochrome [Betaproteobacteria bacterium]|nr:c-type cytochrome [Betaproteobacteria bacterium]
MKKILISIVAIASIAVLPLAAQAQTSQTWNEKSAELTKVLETKGDPERGAAAFVPCQGCHRSDAMGKSSGAYPRLAGQHASVLLKQMTDIRSGLRNNPKMEEYVEDHLAKPENMADIAAYVSALPIVEDKVGRGPGTAIQAGKTLFERDCVQCHGNNGEGDAQKFYPMVAAQHYRYLLRELHYIRDGDRGNSNPDMVKVVKPYREADLEALADYMSSLPPPKK